jgi:hypothetical protein
VIRDPSTRKLSQQCGILRRAGPAENLPDGQRNGETFGSAHNVNDVGQVDTIGQSGAIEKIHRQEQGIACAAIRVSVDFQIGVATIDGVSMGVLSDLRRGARAP